MTAAGYHCPCSRGSGDGATPVIVMVINQMWSGGVNIFYRLAAQDGMNLRIVVAYRFLFATAFLFPLALVIERNRRPTLTWAVLLQAFCCALLGGALGQNLSLASIAMTSATYGAAMNNLIPAFTFVFAVFFGLEKLRIKRADGIAKVVGTLMGIGGAMVLTFYKGLEIHIWPTHDQTVHSERDGSRRGSSQAQPGNPLVGSMLAVGACVSYAMYMIIQAKLTKRYPCPFSSTAIILAMSAAQAVMVALCGKGEWSEWKLGWNIRLLAVSYMGIMGSGICLVLVVWCMKKRGPLFAAVFNPLCLVFVAVVGSIFLGEKLHLGSLIGAALIVIGLYLVVWAKSEETKVMEHHKLPSKISQLSSQSTASTAMAAHNASTLGKDHDHIIIEDDNHNPPDAGDGPGAAAKT
ncbi:hypothetical protein MLD38_032181 [Melastoma candidum]|uniref:Uncharacterized protein n=1 Tax=Melastoma candidum TaxID=119954 RepID=A0ACB9M3G9_9MYRT|nr:hypothetical protein MLD38_032181 [Melastoma candidum]